MWSIKCLCWINMDGCVSSQQVLDYFHGLKRVSVCHPSTLRSASVVSHITLLHSLACSGNEGLPSARFRGCGALAFELGSSQLSSLFSRALPQVVLTLLPSHGFMAVPALIASVCFCFAWKRLRTPMTFVCVHIPSLPGVLGKELFEVLLCTVASQHMFPK